MNGVSEIAITISGQVHKAILGLPEGATSIVIFAHGSGSSRLSRRNNFVAEVIRRRAIATLLFDLLTEEEDRVYANRFDIPLLTTRLIETTRWIQKQPEFAGFRLGYFGASTGAAAALQAAAQLGKAISAVVSRGGRPDLAGTVDLNLVLSPTLLIVGGDDNAVIELNQQAYTHLTAVKNLKIIPGATHLFEEPGTLEQAANLAADWFEKYLVGKTADRVHA